MSKDKILARQNLEVRSIQEMIGWHKSGRTSASRESFSANLDATRFLSNKKNPAMLEVNNRNAEKKMQLARMRAARLLRLSRIVEGRSGVGKAVGPVRVGIAAGLKRAAGWTSPKRR